MSLGLESDLTNIVNYIGKEKKYEPNEENFAAYRALIPIFIRLSRELATEYQSIADFQRHFPTLYK